MRALVVYETMFGTTGLVADAIAGGLAPFGHVEVLETGPALRHALTKDLRLLVVGAPAYGFGMSRPVGRYRRARLARIEPVGIGIREWIRLRGWCLSGIAAATFDTRPTVSPTASSAARAAARALRACGADIVAAPMTFLETGPTGQPAQGELARARNWGEWLATELPAFAIPHSRFPQESSLVGAGSR